mgnify:CR=1 FL=1
MCIRDSHYTVLDGDKKLVDGPIEKINEGFVYDRPMSKKIFKPNNDKLPEIDNYNNLMLKILAHENVSSREPIYESYDKNVQGRVVNERGQSNAGIVAPFDSDNFPNEIKEDRQTRRQQAYKTSKEEVLNSVELARRNRDIGGNVSQKNNMVETITREKRKIGRNERVTVRNMQSGEKKELKFKQAQNLINSGNWIIVEKQ